MAAIVESLLDEFGEVLEENPKFSTKQSVKFKNMLLKMLDFDRQVFSYYIDVKI